MFNNLHYRWIYLVTLQTKYLQVHVKSLANIYLSNQGFRIHNHIKQGQQELTNIGRNIIQDGYMMSKHRYLYDQRS